MKRGGRPALARLTLAVCLALPGAASALSCLPPDIARTYAEAEAAETRYSMVLGRLDFDADLLPDPGFDPQDQRKPDTEIPARLVGHAASPTGFDVAYEYPVTLRLRCFGPWCAGARAGERYLAFLDHGTIDAPNRPPVLELTPCGGFGFAAPNERLIAQALNCLRGTDCTPAAP